MSAPRELTREITVDGRRDALPALLAFVDATCDEAGLDAESAFAVRLATEEACTNVIAHGYAECEAGPLSVRMTCEPARVVVTITDRAAPFDPETVAAPSLDASAESRTLGGLGWHLIRRVMDEVRQEHPGGIGNRLTMIKRLIEP